MPNIPVNVYDMFQRNGENDLDIPEAYKEYGMYLYEARKEYAEEAEEEITFDELIGKVLLVGISLLYA